MSVAERLNRVSESETIAMAKKGRELEAQGKKIISLSFGEPDFPTPGHIKQAAIKAINDNFSKYTPVAGIPDLREAISQKFLRENGLNYAANQIVVSTGAKHSVMNAVLALVNKGDEVIIPTPYWVSYSEMVNMAEGVNVFIDADIKNNFKITPEQLEKAITPKTKLFMFSSPNNPTGMFYNDEELTELAKVFERHPQVYIISDEIYEHINFTGKHLSIANYGTLYNRTVTINGLSKAFAMTGWRIGYIGAPLEIAKACETLQSQFTSGTNSIAQKAAVEALNGTMEPTIKMKEKFFERRNLFHKLISDIPDVECILPDGAFYLFPNISKYFGKQFEGKVINNSSDLSMFLLEQGLVVTVAGSAFGNDNCIRLSYATNTEKLIEAAERIKNTLALLK